MPVRGRRMSLAKRAALTGEIIGTYRRARRLHGPSILPRRWRRSGRKPAPPAKQITADPGARLFAAVRIGRAVILVLGRLPADRRCLIRSLVVSSMLARRQIPARLVLGVRPDADDPFLAHAWVEHAGVPVIPHEGYSRLHDL